MSAVYDIITNKIIEALDKGTVPWQIPWKDGGRPRNMTTGRAYTGMNHILLLMSNYSSPYWGTYNNIKKLGGNVKKGESGTLVIFWKPYVDKEENKRLILRYYKVFNLDQTEGVTLPKKHQDNNENIDPATAIDCCEEIVKGFVDAPYINFSGGMASYFVDKDTISMPPMETFHTSEGYYATLFHELAHSTGHKSRLNREIKNGFGSEKYAKEELLAEMAAAMLVGTAGIEVNYENTAAYIASWKKKLQDDPKLIITAASHAQKAADYILGIKKEKEEDND